MPVFLHILVIILLHLKAAQNNTLLLDAIRSRSINPPSARIAPLLDLNMASHVQWRIQSLSQGGFQKLANLSGW